MPHEQLALVSLEKNLLLIIYVINISYVSRPTIKSVIKGNLESSSIYLIRGFINADTKGYYSLPNVSCLYE